MKKLWFQRLSTIAVAGMCFTGCTNGSRSGSEPPRQQAPEVVRDAEERIPIVFDYRQVVDAQDLSGLAVGTHTVEFDVYAPSQKGWTPDAERQVIRALRVLHVDTRIPAATRLDFLPLEGHRNARRVRVEMDLTQQGSWIVILGDGLVAAHANPELLTHYGVREPQSLKPAGAYEFLSPHLMLRTVGSCNHVYKVTTEVDDKSVLRTVRLHFSEPLEPTAVTRGLGLSMRGSQGQASMSVGVQGLKVAGKQVELHVPPLLAARGALELRLTSVPGLAGRFREALSCTQADGLVGVGYFSEAQSSGEYVVAPLQQAASRALGEEK